MSSALRIATTLSRTAASRVRPQHLAAVAHGCKLMASRSWATAVARNDEGYVSPFQDLFDVMEENGPTTLGTTEYVPTQSKFLKCGVPESALRFTTTSYGRLMMPPHVHPNEHRVVLKVNTNELPLSEIELEILREIVGTRLNDDRCELRFTSNQFGSRIENKRHLVSMLDRIILSVKRLAKEIPHEGQEEKMV